MRARWTATTSTSLSLAVLALCASVAVAWRSVRLADDRHWCEQVRSPLWPFAYSKFVDDTVEEKVWRDASGA
jgi:hypothetical protein